jgi:acetolactate synthase I/III small subunit
MTSEPIVSREAPAARQHTLVVRLHDRPGALYRAIGLIRRRDYNVASLLVGASDRPGTSRMVLVIEAAEVHQVVQQLSRLVDVLSVAEIAPDDALVGDFVNAMQRFDLRQSARGTTSGTPPLPSIVSSSQELVR